jgi:hypothetical protein
MTGLLTCTVHDSVLIDCPKHEVAKTCKIVYSVFDDLPKNFEKLFKVPFPLKLGVETQVGKTWGSMLEITKETLDEVQSA